VAVVHHHGWIESDSQLPNERYAGGDRTKAPIHTVEAAFSISLSKVATKELLYHLVAGDLDSKLTKKYLNKPECHAQRRRKSISRQPIGLDPGQTGEVFFNAGRSAESEPDELKLH